MIPPQPSFATGPARSSPASGAAATDWRPPGAWQRFRRARPALSGLVLLLTILTACYGSLPVTGASTRQTRLEAARQPPSRMHPLGTDELGRDLLARTLYGGALSLGLGMLAAAVAVLIGSVYGAVAGYVGGRCDGIMMRIVDVLYALPYMLLVMLLTASLGAWLERWHVLGGEWSRFVVLAVAIGSVSWLTVARVIRGQVLSLREQPFVEAARALGLSTPRIVLVHILPNTLGPMLVFATLTVPQAMLQESFLSFLGVGVQPPQASWGSLAADGIRALSPIECDWWLVVFPCAALSLTLLALNFIGDGLREALGVRRD